MPTASDYINEPPAFMRILAYGAPKTKKTLWAAKAAEAGFNVTFFEFDTDGARILLSGLVNKQGIEKINVIDCSARLHQNAPYGFMRGLFTQNETYFNETTGIAAPSPLGWKTGTTYAHINLKKLNANDIIVIDSFSSYVDSLLEAYAANENISLVEAEKQTWDGWGWMGRVATWALRKLTSLPCHLIVIGHEQNYEKRLVTAEGKTYTAWIRQQPKSVSGPHGQTLSGYFSDCLYFYLKRNENRISTRTKEFSDVGSRIMAPDDHPYAALPFTKIADYSKVYAQQDLLCQAVDFGVVGR